MAQHPVPPARPSAASSRLAHRGARGLAALTSIAALTGAFLVGTPGARAATIDVTTTADGGAGSLRAAISLANGTPGADLIQVPAGTYVLTIPGRDEDGNATGDLDISGDVTIVGAGAGTIIDGGGIDRVLDIRSGSVAVQSVTVRNGDSGPGTTSGGGIRQVEGTLGVIDAVVRDNHTWSGGGIQSTGGVLSVVRSEIVENTATSEPGNGSNGAGISKSNTSGSLTIVDSLIANNDAVVGNGGGLYSNSPATSIVNTTFTGNTQNANTILFEQYGNAPGTVGLRFVTIAGNASGGGPGGITTNVGANASESLTLEGVLLQDNAAGGSSQNCAVQASGAFTSLGSNLSDDPSCTAFTQPTDLADNALTTLAPLAANGGPTRTLALVAGSSAVDAATCDPSVTTDQRGAPRPVGAACDIGAFELGGAVPPSTTTTFLPTTTSTAPTSTTTSTTAPSTTTTSSTSTSSTSTSSTSTSTSAPTTTSTSTTVPTTSTTLPATTTSTSTTSTSTTSTSTSTSTTSTSTTSMPTTTTSSTSSTSTSTVPSSTTSTAPTSTSTSTTSPTGSTSSTTAPSSSTTSSTSSSSTTTTAGFGDGSSTTASVPPAVVAAGLETFSARTTTGTLPVTGAAETLRFVLLAIGLLTGGLAFVLSARHLAGQRLAQHLDEQR